MVKLWAILRDDEIASSLDLFQEKFIIFQLGLKLTQKKIDAIKENCPEFQILVDEQKSHGSRVFRSILMNFGFSLVSVQSRNSALHLQDPFEF